MLQSGVILITALCAFVHSLPSTLPTKLPPSSLSTTINPLLTETEPLSLEGLDYLLRRAEKLFRTPNYNEQSQPEPYLRLNERLQPPTDEPYNFYLPLYKYNDNDDSSEKIDSKSKHLLKFSPPKKSHEHNYYAAKPKKNPKKYSSSVKHLNVKTYANPKIYNEWEAIYGNNFNNNNDDDYNQQDKEQHKIIFDDSYFGIDSNLPAVPEIIVHDYFHDGREIRKSLIKDKAASVDFDDREEGEKELPILLRKEHEPKIHNFDGPKSYKFGYDTGKGKDRQFRFEERNGEGNVKGQYGYIDKNGKMNIVKYLSSAEKGFQIVY